jgi:photosystem II stability/assembly factor-like uncharacterized protein
VRQRDLFHVKPAIFNAFFRNAEVGNEEKIMEHNSLRIMKIGSVLAVIAMAVLLTTCGGAGAPTSPGDDGTEVNQWTSLGPEGSDVLTISIEPTNPLTLYIGTDGGGVFRSTNRGGNWTAINTGLKATYVPAMAIDPTNTTTLYASAAGRVYKSANGGSNWTEINPGLTGTGITALAIDPVNTMTLYAGTWSGVYKSYNGGTNWTKISTSLAEGYVNTLAIDPVTTNTIYVGTDDGIFNSTNGGTDWTDISIGQAVGNVNTLAIDPVTTNKIYVGTDGGMFKSIDGGTNWTAINTGLTGTYVGAIAIDPVTTNTIYASVDDEVYKSTDGGVNWTISSQSLGEINSLAIDPIITTRIYAATQTAGVCFYDYQAPGEVIPAPAPEIVIIQGNASIASGGNSNFGIVGINTLNDVTFTIENLGADNLNLTGVPDKVVVSGTDASLFTIISQPASPIYPSGNSPFMVRFLPTSGGVKTANLTVTNDDPDENLYTFIITATGIVLPAELPATGQTSGSVPGEDGDLRKGVSWPSPRFTDNGDGTITDNLTGLMWDKNANRYGARTWTEALSDANDLVIESYDDWRLPNVVELRSLINAGQSEPYTWLNSEGFSDVQANYYWLSTSSGTDAAMIVNMIDGTMHSRFKTETWFLCAVRDYQPGIISLPKTGQTVSYSTGDDGELQKGVSWPSPRFVDNGFGALTDTLTGLMWEKAPSGTIRRNWTGALEYASSITLGGYTDWRIPNINERISLAYFGQSDYTSWLSSQGFVGGGWGYRWTSTRYAGATSWAVVGNGYMWNFGWTVNNYVWVVRCGQ